MKKSFLKINNPCNVKWESMSPNKEGSFCDFCEKNVIDLTKLNSEEINDKLGLQNKNECVRIRKEQIENPFLIDSHPIKNKTSYSRIITNLALVTTIVSNQPLNAENKKLNQVSFFNTSINEPYLKHVSFLKDHTIIKGEIISKETKNPINYVDIYLFTLKKFYHFKTTQNGQFSFEIPTELIDDDNLIEIHFDSSHLTRKEHFDKMCHYENQTLILTKKEISEKIIIEAEPEKSYLGFVDQYSIEDDHDPIVLDNGNEIDFSIIKKAREKSFNEYFSNKKIKDTESEKTQEIRLTDFHYFEPKKAIALYGEKAKYGLYIKIPNK